MKLLAIETSTSMLSVALYMDGRSIERGELCANGGSDRVLPWVHEVLADGGVSLRQLDGIAFGSGPGGFTGLRLACSAAQGLAYGADLPVVPIITLAALALADGSPRVLTCIDARMNEVYAAVYAVANDEVRELAAPIVTPPEQLPIPPGRDWKARGDGFTSYHDVLVNRLGDAIASIDASVPALAPSVARLAAGHLRTGKGVAARDAAPFYVREKVALTTQERLARGGSK